MSMTAQATIEFMTGFGLGCAAGYGFALKTALQSSKDLLELHKEQISELKEKVKVLEGTLYPIIDRRKPDRNTEE